MKTEWVHKKLGDLGYSYSGLSGKTIDDFGEGKPFIPYMNIFSNGEIDPNKLEYVRIADNEHQNKVEQGDWFFTTSSETPEEVGMTSVLVDNIGEAYLNSFCFGFRLYNKQEFDPKFASYLFRSEELRKKISLFAQGSTRYNLPKQQMFEKLFISYPESLSTQRRIAAILASADKVIAATQKLIAKYKQMKQGMMEELLKPKEGWKMVKLGKCSEIITGPFGSSLHEKDYTKEGTPVINPQNMVNNKIIAIDSCLVNDETVERLSKYKMKSGDIVIARRGEMGRCAVVEANQEGWLCGTGSFVIKVHPEKIDAHFLQLQLGSNSTKIVLENNSIGATMSNLNQSILSELEIDTPSLVEQRRIAAILSGIDAKIAAEEKVLEKYEKVKKGMMGRMLEE